MDYQEYLKKTFELAHQTQEKMLQAADNIQAIQDFSSLSIPEMSAELRHRIEWMLIEGFRHQFIEIVTMIEEQERLTQENEPDIEKRMNTCKIHARFREDFEKLYKTTKKFMKDNADKITKKTQYGRIK